MSQVQGYLIDTSGNLAHRLFKRDLKEVIMRAFNARVLRMIMPCQSTEDFFQMSLLVRTYSTCFYMTVGIHPHYTQTYHDEYTIPILRRFALEKGVVAIGECGLDFARDFSPRRTQEKWFEAQIELAEELQLPLYLHERDAEQRFVEILAANRKKAAAVLHCFTGGRQALRRYLDMGLHIGITGWICDERRGADLRDIVREIPDDRLMIGTDSPFLWPFPDKPKNARNEPANLPRIVQTLAKCTGKSDAEVAEVTTKTAIEFFGLKKTADSNQ